MSITDFLLQRIAELEQLAQDAGGAEVATGYDEDDRDKDYDWPEYPWGQGRGGPLISAMTPARVLAECAAKRLIIERAWSEYRELEGWGPDALTRTEMELGSGTPNTSTVDVPAIVVILATMYADHADFDPSWAVT